MISIRQLRTQLSERFALTIGKLDIHPRRLTVIVGPNGAGKSTLGQIMVRMLKPDSGTIVIAERPLAAYRQEELVRELAYMGQGTGSGFPHTVAELAGMAAHAVGRATDAAIETALIKTDMQNFARERLDHLSGGEQQRAFLAATLAQSCPLLWLDEPTSEMDIHHQLQVMELLREEVQKHSKTVVLITHQLHLALRYADHLVVMQNGHIAGSGTPSDMRGNGLLDSVFMTNIDQFYGVS
jgi:ABC-type cobalamin/Fe3+-siderophores transport system ATPase subunit